MAAIVRVKRRLEEDPAESLVIFCKKLRSNNEKENSISADVPEEEIKSVFKFAGTINSEDKVTHCVSTAIRRVKLQNSYKENYRESGSAVRNARRRTNASHARYAVVAEKRALDFGGLESDSTTDARQTLDGVSSCASSSTSCESSRLFHLYDVEKLESTQQKSKVEGSETIVCNGVPLVRETVVPGSGPVSAAAASQRTDESPFVYDLYYFNDAKFDYRALENILAVEAYKEEGELCDEVMSDEEEEGYDDEDDENAENNWRNDYPDDDPTYFSRLHLDDDYGADDFADDHHRGDRDNETDETDSSSDGDTNYRFAD